MKKLFLITQFYPFKKNEESFILPELKRLKNEFDVTVIAADVSLDAEIKAKIPSDVKVVRYDPNSVRLARLINKNIGLRLAKVCKTAKASGEYNKHYYVKGMTFERWFRKNHFVDKDEEFVIYSYWFLWWNLGFAEHKERYPNMKLITRAHGFDLYDERHRDGRQPFRKYLDSRIDKVLFVSQMGMNYYLERQANQPVQYEKYVVSYLGQEDFCGDSFAKKDNDSFTIVSCSNVIPLKRVELIADALATVKSDMPIRWVHFGDGPSMESLNMAANKALSANGNLTIELKGRVDNLEVLDFYKKDETDLFITTSSTEGLPVSISEAMSFGLPIIATDVGGIKEQVEGNGILLSPNPLASEVAGAIERIMHMDSATRDKMGKISREIWKKKFDISVNIKEFIKAIN